jgi:hypothetical protein
VNYRSREIDTLFQRMAGGAVALDAAAENDAARAVQDWPLLAMLTHAKIAAAATARWQAPVTTAEEPMPLVSPMTDAEPAFEPELIVASAPAAEPPSRLLSPLEQLFRRAEETGKPQSAQSSVFAPAAPQAPMAPLTAPPLKTPASQNQGRLPSLTQPQTAPPQTDDAVAIEPKPRQWRELDTVPAHLFDRVGAR